MFLKKYCFKHYTYIYTLLEKPQHGIKAQKGNVETKRNVGRTG